MFVMSPCLYGNSVPPASKHTSMSSTMALKKSLKPQITKMLSTVRNPLSPWPVIHSACSLPGLANGLSVHTLPKDLS